MLSQPINFSEGLFLQGCSVLTLSPTVLSARMVLSQVGILEFVVASICLIAAIWLLRKAAEKIFELGILIYGKEPSNLAKTSPR